MELIFTQTTKTWSKPAKFEIPTQTFARFDGTPALLKTVEEK